MNNSTDFAAPWQVKHTSRHAKTGGGYNVHIMTSDGRYVAESVVNEDLARLIVEAVNGRAALLAEIESLRAEVAALREDGDQNHSHLAETEGVAIDAMRRAEIAEAALAEIEPGLYVWLIERTDAVDYDEYRSQVRIAASEDEARRLYPSAQPWPWGGQAMVNPATLDVIKIGAAVKGSATGQFITANFKAG